jgi:hypothetical protein
VRLKAPQSAAIDKSMTAKDAATIDATPRLATKLKRKRPAGHETAALTSAIKAMMA